MRNRTSHPGTSLAATLGPRSPIHLLDRTCQSHEMDLATILQSAFVAALVSALFTWRSAERRIQIENITQERAKWREKIRGHALSIHRAASRRHRSGVTDGRAAMTALLNPFDADDQAILTCIDRIASNDDTAFVLREFADRIAYLLKHDWERAKHEAKWLRCCEVEPRRKSYP